MRRERSVFEDLSVLSRGLTYRERRPSRQGERQAGLGAPRDDNHVRAQDTVLLEEFVHRQPDAVIEAGKHSGIGYVGLGLGVEMEDLLHQGTLDMWQLGRNARHAIESSREFE